MYDPVDHDIRENFEALAEKSDTDLKFLKSPGFLASRTWNKNYFEDHKYFQLNYYKEMRKKFDILIAENGGPVGGKWSFDTENRKKMPQDLETPDIPKFSSEKVEKSKKYVEKNFSDNPGSMENFFGLQREIRPWKTSMIF